MQVTLIGRDRRVLRAAIAGEIDASNCFAVGRILLAEKPEGRDVVIDMSHCTFIDSSGVSELLDLRSKVADAGGHVTLVDIQRPVRRVLEILGLVDVFERPVR